MERHPLENAMRQQTLASANLGATLRLPRRLFVLSSFPWISSLRLLAERIQPGLPWVIIALGIVLRVSQYSLDRSLFLDEAFIATNLSERSIAGLLRPLAYDQRAPAGFLICVKLVTLACGNSDMALRLVPLISGIVSLFLFAMLSHKLLPRVAANFALLLFAGSPTLIFMSSDLKQYSTDALMTTAILLTTVHAVQTNLKFSSALLLGLVGAVAVWFAFPAVFVLASMGMILAVMMTAEKKWQQGPRLALVAILWAAGFVSVWWMQLRFFESEPSWKQLWNSEFMPLPPRSAKDLWWLAERFFHLVTTPVGLTYEGLAGLAALAGVIAFYRQSRFQLAVLLAPILITVLASGFRIYPVSGRSIIFMAPPLTLIIVAGIHYIRVNVTQAGLGWIWVFVVFFTCSDLAQSASSHLTKGRMYRNQVFWDYQFEEIKRLMTHVRGQWQPGDLVYLYSQSYVAFEHYADQFGFQPEDWVRGIEAGLVNPEWNQIKADLAQYAGRKRVWFLFTHNWLGNGVNERKLYRYFLDQQGRCLDALEPQHPIDAAVFLYDLSRTAD